MDVSPVAYVALSGTIAGLALLIVVIVSWKLLRRLGRLLAANSGLFGDSAAARIISLGVTALFFRDAVLALLLAPIRLFDRLLGVFPDLPERIAIAVRTTGGASEVALDQSLFVLHAVATDVYQAFSTTLANLPLLELLLALAFWVFVGTSFGSVQRNVEGATGAGDLRVVRYFRNLAPGARQMVFLSVTLLAGAYLSIAAIVAIPWLDQEDIPEELSTEALEEMLQRATLSQEQFDTRFPPEYGPDKTPFDELRKVVAAGGAPGPVRGRGTGSSLRLASTAGESVPEGASNQEDGAATELPVQEEQVDDVPPSPADDEVAFLLSTVDQQIEWREEERAYLLQKWTDFRQQAFRAQQEILEQGGSEFATHTLNQMNRQERAAYFQALVRWHRGNLTNIQRSLDETISFLESRDRQWERWADRVGDRLRRSLTELQTVQMQTAEGAMPADRVMDGFLDVVFEPDVEDQFISDRPLFRLNADLYYVPVPPEPGLGWGPFGTVSRWLLRTRSMELALISGMLGFGLLGAAISSYVRGRAGVSAGTRIPDLAGVIVRGISAAIVIFLAVEGGLSLFSASSHELNPYVLFFTCLVGAVYSESVWDWAVEKLNDGLGQEEDGEEEPPNDAQAG